MAAQDESPRGMRTFLIILGGQLISMLGTGAGGGIGLGFIFAGWVLVLACGLAYANPRLRLLEVEIPDAV
jgi:hypothetical protein